MAMDRSVNHVILVGRVGSIYPRKKMRGGKPGPQNISMQTQEIFREGKGRSDWHHISFWGTTADFIEKYLEVGALVAIEGSLRTTQIKNADGSLSSYVNIEGKTLTLIMKPMGGRATQADEGEPEDVEGQEKEPEDDIPF